MEKEINDQFVMDLLDTLLVGLSHMSNAAKIGVESISLLAKSEPETAEKLRRRLAISSEQMETVQTRLKESIEVIVKSIAEKA